MVVSSLGGRGGSYRGYAPRPRRWWHKEPVVTSSARATDSEGVGDQSQRHARPDTLAEVEEVGPVILRARSPDMARSSAHTHQVSSRSLTPLLRWRYLLSRGRSHGDEVRRADAVGGSRHSGAVERRPA